MYYLYVIRCARRDALAQHLAARGIGTQKIYATPAPMQPCYQFLEYAESDIPRSAQAGRELLCLPIFPELSDDEVDTVAACIREFFEQPAARTP